MLIAQLTDLHITDGPQGELAVWGAARAVERVNALRPAPAAVVITGDVTDDGSPESYRLAATILAGLTAPVYVIPGNHDDRAGLRAAFGANGGGAYCQQVVELGAVAVVMCDSVLLGTDAGALDDGRLEWIDDRLTELGQTPTVVAIHHPPIVTGIALMDEIGLADIPSFAEMVARHAHVCGVIAGHVHRSITGRVAHVPVVVCPSTLAQLRLDLNGRDTLAFVDEPQAFAIHRIDADGGLVSHTQPTAPSHVI